MSNSARNTDFVRFEYVVLGVCVSAGICLPVCLRERVLNEMMNAYAECSLYVVCVIGHIQYLMNILQLN